jgi:hypothetical protein
MAMATITCTPLAMIAKTALIAVGGLHNTLTKLMHSNEQYYSNF